MTLSPCGIEYVINEDGTPGRNWCSFSGCENWHNGVCGGGGQDFYCWAKGLVKGRLRQWYPYGFEPTFYPDRLRDPERIKKPQTIAVSFMGDLFGDWKTCQSHDLELGMMLTPMDVVRQRVLAVVRDCPQHRFLFLTKCPWNLRKWNPWPDNAFVGMTATDSISFEAAYLHLMAVQARTKYISLEPLLSWDLRATEPMMHQASQAGVKWLILGAATGTMSEIGSMCMKYPDLNPLPYGNRWTMQPPVWWVEAIEAACDQVGIKVWLKDNLRPLLGDKLRQERP